jgi:hypothetical protein
MKREQPLLASFVLVSNLPFHALVWTFDLQRDELP